MIKKLLKRLGIAIIILFIIAQYEMNFTKSTPIVLTPDEESSLARINSIGDALLRSYPGTGEQIKFYLIPGKRFNAYARIKNTLTYQEVTSERQVLLFTGLVNSISSDDELAWVIAHELAHHFLGHVELYNVPRAGASYLKSIHLEIAADYLATVLTFNAGYNSCKSKEFMVKLHDLQPNKLIPKTHPLPISRLLYLTNICNNLMFVDNLLINKEK